MPNYRSIALLNSDLKIFMKILATRLHFWLPQFMHKNQVGFIPCQQAGDTRRAINLIKMDNMQDEEALRLSLDTEKAFDRLNWPFMLETLQAYGLKGAFLTVIKGLYSSPLASIKMLYASSSPEWYTSGMSPLSPIFCSLH